MTLTELTTLLATQNGILSEQNILDFRNSYFNEPITQAWMADFIDLDNEVDWVLSDSSIYALTSKIVVDFLLTDNFTAEEELDAEINEIDLEYDVVTKSEGDQAERKLRLSALPQDLKDQILLEIGARASAIESTKLQTAINNVIP